MNVSYRHRLCLLAAGVLIGIAGPASAQLSKTESSCRGAISKSIAKYTKAFGKAVVACHVARDLDASMSATDCNDISAADPDGKVTKVATSASEAIAAKCLGASSVLAQFPRCPSPHETNDDGDATTGIDSFEELASCLLAHAETLAAQTAENVMGLPAPPLSASLAACHKTLGSAYTKVVDTTIKVRASCQKAADKLASSVDFVCATSDPKNKIAGAEAKARAAILEACGAATGALRGKRSTALETLGSCADTADALADCVVEEQTEIAAGGTAAMAFELPGECPGAGSLRVTSALAGTQTDIGFSGIAHDAEPIVGYDAITFPVTCDADCQNCGAASAVINPDACRCSNSPTTTCTTNADCGGTCQCQFGPPAAYNVGGTPACVVSQIDWSISGSYDAESGDMDLHVPVRGRLYLGGSIGHPCPRCVAGTCDGGSRDGLACSVDGLDATFGAMSYDCPPRLFDEIGNVLVGLDYSTGSTSVANAIPCDAPNGGLNCQCGMCSGDNRIGCASNADCAPSYGTCGTAPSTRPNFCTGFACNPDPSDPTEGLCGVGDDDRFCSGLLRANGKGLITCGSNSDCQAYTTNSSNSEDWICPNDNCGNCTITQRRECYLDPIVATGSPGQTIVGTGCFGVSTNAAVNSVMGLPGAYRVRHNLAAVSLCSDGVTPFYPPGGSNCP